MYIVVAILISAMFGGMAGNLFDWWGLVLTIPVAAYLGHIGALAEGRRSRV